jgi:hypothetical protein
MLKIPVQLLRNSFWINFIQPGIPLVLWDLLALRDLPLRYRFPTLPFAKARNPPKRTIAAPTTLMPCPWQLVGVAC